MVHRGVVRGAARADGVLRPQEESNFAATVERLGAQLLFAGRTLEAERKQKETAVTEFQEVTERLEESLCNRLLLAHECDELRISCSSMSEVAHGC